VLCPVGSRCSIMAQLKPFRGDYYLWEYVPSKAAAILFTILFIIATGAVIWRMVRTKTLFSIAFTIGGLCKSQHPPLPPFNNRPAIF